MANHHPPSEHLVQFYDSSAFLADSAARYLGAGLGSGDAVLLLATPFHREAMRRQLASQGFDLSSASYLALDAATTLSQFLVDGWPDERKFHDVVGGAIMRASGRGAARVRAFGEMVSLLVADGRPEAALRLEELWNELAEKLPFTLLCAYPMSGFPRAGDGRFLEMICERHARVMPTEAYNALPARERLAAVVQLQQKAVALEAEVVQGRAMEVQLQAQQRELRQSTETVSALVQASPLPIVVLEPDTTVRLWNPAAERTFGWSAAEVLGRPTPVAPPDLDAVARGESFAYVETQRQRRDGTRLDVAISGAPLRAGDPPPHAWVLLFDDVSRYVSDRRQTNEFLAMLGHELRNPLSAVRNALVTADLDPSRRERAFAIARRQTDQLTRLVDDLLDVARITQGKVTLRTQRVPLSTLVQRAVDAARPLTDEATHTVTVSWPPEDVYVDGDPARLEQVLVNLLSNAAKYTPPGGAIDVSARREGDVAVLRVRDDGAGIAPDVLPQVFDLFVQGSRSLDRAQGGLGLGLTLVRRLVELHRGSAHAHSDGIGRGAEFVVRLPVAARAAGVAVVSAPAPQPHQGQTHVLLVEDNADAADGLSMLLELAGHQVRVACDGIAALELARAVVPDVMLVDIGLPGMDGYEVARQVRRDPAMRGMILVALTGYGRDEDRARSAAAGFDHHLVKPFDLPALEQVLRR